MRVNIDNGGIRGGQKPTTCQSENICAALGFAPGARSEEVVVPAKRRSEGEIAGVMRSDRDKGGIRNNDNYLAQGIEEIRDFARE